MEQKNSEGKQGYEWGTGWRIRLGQRGWLRPTVLRVLEKKPMNGMEIMENIRNISHGWWRPSPGSVYPLLESLAMEGLIKKGSDGRYRLWKWHQASEGPFDELDAVFTNMESDISYLDELKQGRRVALSKKQEARIAGIIGRLSRLRHGDKYG